LLIRDAAVDLKTTTGPQRHPALLQAVARELPRQGQIRVLEVGPGLVLKRLGKRARPGSPLRSMVKLVETLLRRLPLPLGWYESFEASEIIDALDPSRTGRLSLTVADINPKPLLAVKRQLGSRVECVNVDIAGDLAGRLPAESFDVVVALTVISRIPRERQPAALRNLTSLTKPGGLIAATAECDFDRREVEPTDSEGLFRRTA
jgi:Methyltransferase domain